MANSISWYNIMMDEEGLMMAAENNNLMKLDNNTLIKQSKFETLNFDELLQDVDYNIFYLNLVKLLQFMESKQDELCFPFISKKYEEIFKAIALDVTVLNSHKLDDGSYRDVCNKIIKVFNDTKEFIVSCTREFREEYNEVLVFKKVYFEQSPMNKSFESSMSSLSSSMDSLNIPQSPCPQYTLEDPDDVDPHVVTKNFKKAHITIVLDFIKITSKHYLTFRNLTKSQTEYLQSVVKSVKNGVRNGKKFGIKSLYTALYEAVQIFRPKYEIVMEPSTKTLINNTLLIKKVAKNRNGPANDLSKYITQENSIEKTVFQPNYAKLKQEKKAFKMSKVIQFVDRLPPEFVKDTLKQVIEFMQDEQRASMILVPTNSAEQQFYRMVFSMARLYINLKFKYNYKPELEKIKALLQQYPCNMPKQTSNPVNMRTGFREVAIIKSTMFARSSFASATKGRLALKKKYIENMSTPPSPSFDMCIKKAKLSDKETSPASQSSEAADVAAMPPPPQPDLSKKQWNKWKQEINRNEKNAAKSAALLKSGICFKPASEEVAKNTTVSTKELTTVLGVKNEWPEALTASKYKPEEAPRKQQSQKGFELRTRRGKRLEQNAQLIKALSVPVQSDKAMKMMRVMGWRGGALGARGNGITEPIMPTLELMVGAGLGHGSQQKPNTKPPNSGHQTPEPQTQNEELYQETDIIVAKTKQLLKNQNFNIDQYKKNQIVTKKPKKKDSYNMDKIYHDPADFHLDMLTGILELLSSDLKTKTIRYKTLINKKYRKFLRSAFKQLSERKTPAMQLGEHLQSIISDILKLYDEMPNVIVSAYLPDTLTEIVLTKQESNQNKVKDIIKRQKKNQDTDKWIKEISKEDTTTFIDGLAPPYHEKKAFKTMKLRVLIIMKILFFVVSEDEEINFVFNKACPCKQKSFVEGALRMVNSKKKFGSGRFEAALAGEIKNRVGEYILDLKFSDNDRILTILKNWYKKTPVDTSDHSEPIKSSSFCINLDNYIDPFEVPKSKKAKGNKEPNGSNSKNSGLTINTCAKQIFKTSEVVSRELNDAINISDSESDDSSDNDNENASGDESQITHDDNTDPNKINSNSITSDKNIDINSSKDNSPICDKDDIKNKDFSIETRPSQTSVEKNKDISTITREGDSIKESFSEDNIDSKTENIDIIDDCIIDPDTDLVDLELSEEVEIVAPIAPNPIDLTGDEINEENIDKEFGTDCDRVFYVDISDKNCDKIHNSVVKMVSNESQTEYNSVLCSEISNVYIVPVNYPQDNLTEKMAEEIQKLIAHAINETKELPLLMCHGVKNGALIYSCHNKKTLLWLHSTMSVASDLKVIAGKKVTKMALKFHCLFDFNINYLFRMIERYNPEISTLKWVVEKSEIHNNYALFLVEMDEISVNYIHASGLALFVGVDKVEFSLIF